MINERLRNQLLPIDFGGGGNLFQHVAKWPNVKGLMEEEDLIRFSEVCQGEWGYLKTHDAMSLYFSDPGDAMYVKLLIKPFTNDVEFL